MDILNQAMEIVKTVGEVGIMPFVTVVLLIVLIQIIKGDSKSRENNSNSIRELSNMLKEILFIQRIQNDTLKIILGSPELFNLIIKQLKQEAVMQAYSNQKEESERTIDAIEKLQKAKEGFDVIDESVDDAKTPRE